MISMNKKYRTRGGQDVRVLCVDGPNDVFPVIAIVGCEVRSFRLDGSYSLAINNENLLDLIEVSPWDDFKIDELVMVKGVSGKWYKRYFAGVQADGRPVTFMHGAKSWNANGQVTAWEECRRPTEDKLQSWTSSK